MTCILKKFLKLAVFTLIFLIAYRLCLATTQVPTMSVWVYHESRNYANEVESWPNGTRNVTALIKDKDISTVLSIQQLPCGREGAYYGATTVEGPDRGTSYTSDIPQMYDGKRAPCDNIQGNNYYYIYDCYLYTVDWDNNASFCKQTNQACFGTSGGIWESRLNGGKGACCGDDSAGDNPIGSKADVDDPDWGNLSCKYCPVGLNSAANKRSWSTAVKGISSSDGCCGDDYNDCLQLVGSNDRYICGDIGASVSGSAGQQNCFSLNPEDCQQSGQPANPAQGTSFKWYWADAGADTALVFNISCAQIPAVSNGQGWIGCTNESFDLSGMMKSACVFSLSEDVGFDDISAGGSGT